VPPGTHCADPPSTKRSPPVLEPVCEYRKRKLKKGDQRRAAETCRLGAGSSPFVRQETWVTGPNLRKCRGFIHSLARDDSGWLTTPSQSNRSPPLGTCQGKPQPQDRRTASRRPANPGSQERKSANDDDAGSHGRERRPQGGSRGHQGTYHFCGTIGAFGPRTHITSCGRTHRQAA
jgi:hypothetical protein